MAYLTYKIRPRCQNIEEEFKEIMGTRLAHPYLYFSFAEQKKKEKYALFFRCKYFLNF
jgi:hypothetical protein